VISQSSFIGKQGLTANSVGVELDKVILFGGLGYEDVKISDGVTKTSESKQHYSANVFVFQAKDNSVQPVEIGAGEKPSPRAFHSGTTFGQQNQYVLIFGGQLSN